MTFATVMLAKVALMLCASFGLFLAFLLARDRVAGRRIDVGLALLALLALFTYSHFGRFHQPRGYVHGWEMFNYYFPTKYADELGYDGLYGAALAADAERATPYFSGVETVRDLRTNRLVPAETLRRDPSFRARFSADRWQAFKRDLAYLQPNYDARGWLGPLQDRGYNAPPPRTALTAPIVRALGPLDSGSIHTLALLDVLLLASLLLGIQRTFGLRAACVAAILFGTSSLGSFAWIGGSFLRLDWLALLGLGICALASRRHGVAGVLFGAAIMLRVFPVLFAFGVLARGAILAWQTRSLPREHAAFAGSLAATCAVLGLASLALAGGTDAWVAWFGKITQHTETVFANHMGLAAFLWQPWTLGPAALALAALVIASLSRADDTQAALLGGVLVYAFGLIAGYYYIYLMLYALWRFPPRWDVRSWLLVTALFLPSAVEIAIRAAEMRITPRYVAASIVLLLAWALLFEQVWRAPESVPEG
ncbi:MAG: hypothetical protein JRG76_17470 [Deltaproteobacteria bacterium]|nr:hypothetical protein [Deltaproteobacteria bacterium]MBW2416290.1 hypothetical protein [Deltaproteobacteria bacterium]